MKSEKNILVAFLLNLAFSAFEFFGGFFTNSVAIISDAVHDMGDAVSIGVSYFLERKSRTQPDKTYTYGYLRYSVIGSVMTTLVLLVGSILVIVNAVHRLLDPQTIHYNGMIWFAIVGVAVNLLAAYITRDGDSLNQKSVNLHMLEDVLGWMVVLVGAVVMRFTDFKRIDPLLSIGVAVYIAIHALSHLKEAVDLFLAKVPTGITVEEIERYLHEVDGVLDVHHIHIWSMDGNAHYATLHIVASGDPSGVKRRVKEALHKRGIAHVTLELETENEWCEERHCHTHTTCAHDHHH